MLIKGIGASNGVCIGKAFVINNFIPKVEKLEIENKALELERFKAAVAIAELQLENIREVASKTIGDEEAEIFEAHLLILQDPEFIGATEMKINSEGVNSEYALQGTIDMFISIFEGMDNEYMMERAGDVRDVGGRIMNILLGIKNTSIAEIHEDCIIVIKDLTPSETAQINKEKVLGFITGVGGRTSHSAIMARTLDIPAVVGIGAPIDIIKDGDMLIINGDSGEIIVNPEEEIIEKYKKIQAENLEQKKQLLILKDAETITLDGRKVELAGNIGNPQNAKDVIRNGGEGVGLFRTEFLYMDSDKVPTEEEQFNAYKEALENMEGKPVIIRTLDIGGDKKLSYLPLEEEMNPFLGYRALRLCLNEKEIFNTQLRALLRASVIGNLKIMFPMVSSVQEIRAAKAVLESVKKDLKKENIVYSENIEIGIMIEIPSAAVISDLLAKEVDFFSIGTNDLIQYTIAVDRMNEKVSYLYDPLHPAVLRLIKLVIDNAHSAGKWVGMCGELAGDLRVIPILIGMGLDEFSMNAPSLLKARKLIRNINFEASKKVADHVLNIATSEEILEYLNSVDVGI
ncbi:phosphoenolpyruvate--protein phosphotransferase [Clostridium sp.]|uniref:phosphoenolpyruvate--protein phosphotransferase n=1 Tax=Clostridium sp. TaxID=1506 RepID=UPI002FC5CEDC